MADEILNNEIEETQVPVLNEDEEPVVEDPTKVLIALRRKSDASEKLAVTKEQYTGYDKRSYAVDGYIIRNEDNDVDLLVSLLQSECIFGDGPEDIPETDKRRKNAPVNPQFYELDGYIRTQWQLNNHHETHESGCAVCEAVKFGWLPSNGEMTWIRDHKEQLNELAEVIGAEPMADAEYWCSTQYSEEYMWHLNMVTGYFGFWRSKQATMKIRPVGTASAYVEVPEPEPEPEAE